MQKTWIAMGSDTQDTVWILWQLVDEIVGLLPDGTVVGGWPYGTRGANINITNQPWLPSMNGDVKIATPRALNFTDVYATVATRFTPTP